MNIEFTEAMRDRLKSARKQMGMTLAELADGTGYSLTTFSGPENGRDMPSPRLLAVWIRRLHLSQEWVANGTGRMFRQEPAFFAIPANEIKPAEARAATLREHASIMLEEAEQLEMVIRESKAIHKSAGGDASETLSITTNPDGSETIEETNPKN